jgi:hypothetical protein
MSDREHLRNLALQNGWEWGDLADDGLARVVRGNTVIWFWFMASDHDTLNCAEASNWKRESYGPAALRRTLREMRTKVPA